jgi:protein-tyrosine phosphatase
VTSRARAADASILGAPHEVDVVLNVELADHLDAIIARYDATNTVYWHLPLDDHDGADACTELLVVCRRAWEIVSRLPDGFHVLVHCRMSISRSVAVVCYILMQRHPAWSFQDALLCVRSKRPCADPNPGFVSALAAVSR